MATTRVLQIGIDPAAVDFTPWPGQDASTLRARITAAELSIREAGYDVTACLLPDDAACVEPSDEEADPHQVLICRTTAGCPNCPG